MEKHYRIHITMLNEYRQHLMQVRNQAPGKANGNACVLLTLETGHMLVTSLTLCRLRCRDLLTTRVSYVDRAASRRFSTSSGSTP